LLGLEIGRSFFGSQPRQRALGNSTVRGMRLLYEGVTGDEAVRT
jgi:hypothetical protein